MFSLEWLVAMFFVWFRKQLKAAAVWSLKLAWFFYRATPQSA